MAVCSPFVGQKLKNHRFGRHEICGYSCSVYYSDFFAWYGETNEDAKMVVTIIPHVSGVNPQLHYIINRELNVSSYSNYDVSDLEDGVYRRWVDFYSRTLWCNAVAKRNYKDLPKIH